MIQGLEPIKLDKECPSHKSKFQTIVPIFLIILLTVCLYYNTFDNELTFWDDNRYVTDNDRVKDLSWEKVFDIFNPWDIIEDKDSPLTEYLPLTTLTHAIDYYFWGLNPTGYHISNLLFYILDIVLLYFFLNLILKDRMLSLLASLIFAVHPVHVESVTWISARKDVLSFIFFILSFYLYVVFVRKDRGRWFYYVGSLVLFVLAFLAKSLVVVLPLLLILYDICFEDGKLKIVNKVPYFLIGILLSLVYLMVNEFVGDQSYFTSQISSYRLGLAILMVLIEYIGMLFIPINLNVFYTYNLGNTPASVLELKVLLYLLILLSILLVSITSYFKGRRLITFSIVLFFIALLPVINIIPTSTLKADRYLFIPSIGFSILIAWGVCRLYSLNTVMKRVVPMVCLVTVLFFSVLTVERNNVWQNGITLWQDSLIKFPDASRPHFILGNEYRHRGMIDMAIEEYEKTLKKDPAHIDACSNLGAMYGMKGRYEDSRSILLSCLVIDASSIRTRLNLAKTYLLLGDKYLARQELAEVLRRQPGNAKALRIMEGF